MEFSTSDHKNGCSMFKNKLQTLVQKARLTLPQYQHVNEGSAHAPMFRASVVIGETRYTSKLAFKNVKVAEEDVARLAYESVKNINLTPQLGTFCIHQEPLFTKSILHEYAVKMSFRIPKYQTLPEGGGSTKARFKSSVYFCGKTFTGEAESKKVAERRAAREAIQSLLVSESGTLHQVINSKERLYASLFAKKKSGTEGNQGTSMMVVPNPGSGIKRKPEDKPTEMPTKTRSYGRAAGRRTMQ